MSRESKQISEEIKNFYSAGTTFSIVGCAGSVQIMWGVLGRLFPIAKHDLVGLFISCAIVLAYAYVIPEPTGYDDAGKLKLTKAEIIFGVINSFVVFAVVLGINAVIP